MDIRVAAEMTRDMKKSMKTDRTTSSVNTRRMRNKRCYDFCLTHE